MTEAIMRTDDLLEIAREIIAKVPSCMAITVDGNGNANARVVNPKPLSDAWTVRFTTDRRSRKTAEIEQSGRLTLAYQYDAGKAYVALIGRAAISNDVAAKTADWKPESYRWHPGGPADPNVVYVDFIADRIEIWSSPHDVVPDPVRGLWAAVLVREEPGWVQSTTFPDSSSGETRAPAPAFARG
jgi:general stress protein 26